MDLSKLSNSELRKLASKGIITVDPRFAGVDDVTNIPVENLPEFKPFKKLIGTGISQMDAKRKYGVDNATISRWAKRNIVPTIGTGPRGAKLVDEGYVAYYASRYKSVGAQKGRRTDRVF